MSLNLHNMPVLITGNTGFKGAWLQKILTLFGAKVFGFSLNKHDNLIEMIGCDYDTTTFGSITNFDLVESTINKIKPVVIFHLAAQPIVRLSYDNPRNTYEVNVMGIVNLLESIRNKDFVKSFVNITTDKVYKNNEWVYPYKEMDVLDGYDPYSNSKSCSELVTATYKRSFPTNLPPISTVRSGNVIGGGDYSKDRIIPDFIKAIQNSEILKIRNPSSTRPYLHVLESLFAYILIALKQLKNASFAGNFNVGPAINEAITTNILITKLADKWPHKVNFETVDKNNDSKHEAGLLKLDTSLIQSLFSWKPFLSLDEAVDLTVKWYFTSINDKNNLIELSNDHVTKYYEKCKHLFK